jgi:hypothetical protein
MHRPAVYSGFLEAISRASDRLPRCPAVAAAHRLNARASVTPKLTALPFPGRLLLCCCSLDCWPAPVWASVCALSSVCAWHAARTRDLRRDYVPQTTPGPTGPRRSWSRPGGSGPPSTPSWGDRQAMVTRC